MLASAAETHQLSEWGRDQGAKLYDKQRERERERGRRAGKLTGGEWRRRVRCVRGDGGMEGGLRGREREGGRGDGE